MSSKKNWSKKITEGPAAMMLEPGVFTWKDPKNIAKSIYKSAKNSKNIKSSPFRSAMSMINFYINRAGKNLSKERIIILDQSKVELRKINNNS